MSTRTIATVTVLVTLLALGALASWTSRIPDIEVRNEPPRTHCGTITRASPVGQAFTCERAGLHRIDVRVTSGAPVPAGELELVLRADSAQGAVVRRAFSAAVDAGASFARFEFDRIADSAGRSYTFEIAPSDGSSATLTAFVAYRGFGEDVRRWGDHIATAAELEGKFTCEHPDLRGVAIPFRTLPAHATATLELWNGGDVGATPTRAARSSSRAPISDGWAFFTFPALADSRWKDLRYRLSVSEGAEPIATSGGLSLVSYHGSGQVSPRLRGLLAAGEPASDRDLVFRAWSSFGPRELVRIARERAGSRIPLALVAWSCAVFVLGLALRRNR
ncbi:MAG: hypothetical protein ACKVWV_11045 [Planctomycetota bacterium]